MHTTALRVTEVVDALNLFTVATTLDTPNPVNVVSRAERSAVAPSRRLTSQVCRVAQTGFTSPETVVLEYGHRLQTTRHIACLDNRG
jgi:hypothetical protein